MLMDHSHYLVLLAVKRLSTGPASTASKIATTTSSTGSKPPLATAEAITLEMIFAPLLGSKL
jgi:hypothetical protein